MAVPVPSNINEFTLSEWIRSHVIPREYTNDSLISNLVHIRQNNLNEKSNKEETFSKREVHIEDSKPVTEGVYLNEKTATQAIDSAEDRFELCIGETETGSSERGELCVNPSGFQPLPSFYFDSIAVEANFDVIPKQLQAVHSRNYKIEVVPNPFDRYSTDSSNDTSVFDSEGKANQETPSPFLNNATTDGDERKSDGEKFIHILKRRSLAYRNAIKQALNVKNLKCYVKVTRKLRSSNSYGKKVKTH